MLLSIYVGLMHKLYLAMQKCFPNPIFLINNVSNTSAEKVGNAREKKGADIIITSDQQYQHKSTALGNLSRYRLLC